MSESILAEFLQQGVELLKEEDPALHALLEREHYRQLHTLTLVAASSIADPSVFACSGASTLASHRFVAWVYPPDRTDETGVSADFAAFGNRSRSLPQAGANYRNA